MFRTLTFSYPASWVRYLGLGLELIPVSGELGVRIMITVGVRVRVRVRVRDAYGTKRLGANRLEYEMCVEATETSLALLCAM